MIKVIKSICLFLAVMFFIPVLSIVVIGCFSEKKYDFVSSIITSIATSLIAAGVVYWFIDKRLKDLIETDDVITVVLKSSDGTKIKCPPISRKDFNRAEVLGYIGMLGGPNRFDIKFINTTDFGVEIRKIKMSKGNQDFIVECTDDEIKQFKFQG